MLTLGIDLASQAKNTAACQIRWFDSRAKIESIEVGLADEDLVRLGADTEKIGIDAPLGWPEAFLDAVTAYRHGDAWPSTSLHDLRFRETDRFVCEEIGKQPLSFSSDRIAVPAFRAALAPQLVGPEQPVDRTGAGRIVEVYPAAALRQWGLICAGYKSKNTRKGEIARARLFADIKRKTSSWLDIQLGEPKPMDEHSLDALIAALVARAAMIPGLCRPIQMNDRIKREGWIALPFADSLGKLPLA